MTIKNRTSSLKLFCVVVCLLASSSLAARGQENSSSAPRRAWITIMATTDLHGNIYPLDYYANKPDARGLARAATIIDQARRENPNTLLLDSGDTIQGTPLVYYHNRKNDQPPDPMMLVMNSLGYAAMAVGNHEYNFGLPVLNKARGEAQFPWLSANIYKKGTNETAYQPYLVKEIAGVRLGVLGLTTPGVPVWENPENYAGLEFREPTSEARKWVALLKDKEHVDVVVIIMHMGLEVDLTTGRISPGQAPHENAAIAIAQNVSDVDVILMGHTHRDVPSVIINGVQLAQADKWARHVARVDLYLEKGGSESNDSSSVWRVTGRAARTISTEGVADDPAVLRLAAPYDRETQGWLNHQIGTSPAEITAAGAQFHDTALLDLVQRVQLEAGGADVSMAASFNPSARIAQGPVTVRDIAGLYTYENTLVVLEVTGAQLKAALEHSAKYFGAYTTGKTAAESVDKKIPDYNFDVAEGVTYDLDISQPTGQRIRNLMFRGQPLEPTRKLKLATNNYRVNGGGGYTMYKDARVVSRSSAEIRDLIIDWVERHKTIPVAATNNWRLLPEAATK